MAAPTATRPMRRTARLGAAPRMMAPTTKAAEDAMMIFFRPKWSFIQPAPRLNTAAAATVTDTTSSFNPFHKFWLATLTVELDNELGSNLLEVRERHLLLEYDHGA